MIMEMSMVVERGMLQMVLLMLYMILSRFNSNTLLGNFNVGVKLTDWASIDVRYSGQYQNSDSARETMSIMEEMLEVDFLSKSISTNINQNFLQMLRLNKAFGDHSLSGSLHMSLLRTSSLT
jgi:hypothetical protein